MAFGKVFVRTESGETHDYSLTKPSTTIGRQPGNDIVLTTTAVSRYHARIDVADGRVYLVDLGSANGTFVNDVQLSPGGSMPLAHGDKIGIGDKLIIYTSPQARGRLDINLAPTPAVVEREGLPFRMVVDEPQQLVAPGARLQLILVLENLGERSLPITVTASGLDVPWVRVDRSDLRLEPGEQAQVTVTVLPPRSPSTLPGRYALTLRAALSDDPSLALEAVREIDVVGYSGLSLAARRGEQPGTYFIGVGNEGNVPLDIELGGYTRGRLLRFEFDPARTEIPPGETVRSVLTVQPRARLRADEPVEFAIVARSHDAAGFYAPLQAKYTPVRRRSAWPVVVAGFLLTGLLFTLLVAAGTWALGLWSFDERDGVVVAPIAVTDTPVVTPGPTPTIVPSPLPSPVPGVSIEIFRVAGGDAIYRTDGALIFTWQVMGDAETGFIALDDPDAPEGTRLLRLEDVRSGVIQFPIAQLTPGNHNFRLVVVDESGAQLAQQVTGVSIEAVTCRVLNAEVPIRTLPDAAAEPAQPPRTLPDVLLAGRTPEADWLWVAYNDLDALDTFGWLPASEINCPPSVPVSEIVVVPPEGDPLLLETAEPGLTATPSIAPATLTPTVTPIP